MGVTTDHEIMQMVCGNSDKFRRLFASNIEDCNKLDVLTHEQALDYIGKRVRILKRTPGQPRRPSSEEAMEVLATMVLSHVPVENLYFRPKAIYLAMMVRRVLLALEDDKSVDDRDYVGNKRLELYVIRCCRLYLI
jgi:DNA-directed RNA polymerase III subunit RPC2